MDKFKKICKGIVDFAPLVIGGSLGLIIVLGIIGVIDIGVTLATIGAFFGKFFLWVIGIAIAIFVVACFFPGVLIILIAAIILIVVIAVIALIGTIL